MLSQTPEISVSIMLYSKMYLKSNLFFFSCLLLSISTAALQFHLLNLRNFQYPQSLPKASAVLSDQPNSTFIPQKVDRGFSIALANAKAFSGNATSEDLLQQRLLRDVQRANSLMSITSDSTTSSKMKGVNSPLSSGFPFGVGEYFTRFGVGTPASINYLTIDTGSDVTWIQAQPCTNCYNQSVPIYNPSNSNTSRNVSCDSLICNSHKITSCKEKKCHYKVNYGDGSFTIGDIRTETFTLSRTRILKVPFGCGHDNEGLFSDVSGLMGLGRGNLSFSSYVGKIFGPKFSYCLVDLLNSVAHSYLMFGDSSVPRKAIYTSLLKNPLHETYYYLNLTGFSVGGRSVRLDPSLFKINDTDGNGGVILDSGTSVTRLARPAYIALRDAFRAGTKNLTDAGTFSILDTCYNLSGLSNVTIPTVALHFGSEMKLKLPTHNYLFYVGNATFCFAFAKSDFSVSIIGNVQQQGFRVVYDIHNNRVGFAHKSC